MNVKISCQEVIVPVQRKSGQTLAKELQQKVSIATIGLHSGIILPYWRFKPAIIAISWLYKIGLWNQKHLFNKT
jgi:hypothetical protein